MFDKTISIKMEPELRHVLAHIYYAIECLAKDCPIGALDNIKSIEGLVMFDGDEPEDWERFYNEMVNRGLAAKSVRKFMKGKKMACRKKSGSRSKAAKKCKGKQCKAKKCKGKKCKGKK